MLDDATDPPPPDRTRAEVSLDQDAVPFTRPTFDERPRSAEGRLDRVVDAIGRYRLQANVVAFLLIMAAIAQAYRTADSSPQPSTITLTTTVPGDLSLPERDTGTAPSRSGGPSVDRNGPSSRFQATTTPSTAETTTTAVAPETSQQGAFPSSTERLASTTLPDPGSTPSTDATTATSVSTTTTLPPTTDPAVLAAPDQIEMDDDKDKTIKVLDNDASRAASLDETTLRIIDPPQHASTYRVHKDHIHYRSLEDFGGTDSLTYQICDTNNDCAAAIVTITVTT